MSTDLNSTADRALKEALFACINSGGEDRRYGGVFTAEGKQAWVTFTNRLPGAADPASLIATLTHERDTLAKAIGEAAQKAGITADGFGFSGPQLVMLADDMAECVLSANAATPDSRLPDITLVAVASTFETEEDGLDLNWTLEGGISELEFPGIMLMATSDGSDLPFVDGEVQVHSHNQYMTILSDRDAEKSMKATARAQRDRQVAINRELVGALTALWADPAVRGAVPIDMYETVTRLVTEGKRLT